METKPSPDRRPLPMMARFIVHGNHATLLVQATTNESIRAVSNALSSARVRAVEIEGKVTRGWEVSSSWRFRKRDARQIASRLGLRLIDRQVHGDEREVAVASTGRRRGFRNFRCMEMSVEEDSSRCENIAARTKEDAMLKCALLASQRRWFGGIAQEGRCGG
jgi:hypothetical protein